MSETKTIWDGPEAPDFRSRETLLAENELLRAETGRLSRALAEAERDAARYRWIRYWNRVDPLRLPEDVSFEHEDDFDAAIDAAMAREEG